MPRKRKPSTTHRREQAKSIARLRRSGVTKSKAGKSGKKLGGSAYALLKKFKPVLQGKATVVKAAPAVVKKYKGTFASARNRLVVPRGAGETVRISRGAVVKRKVVARGETPLRVVIPPKLNSLTDLPRGRGYRYRVNMGTSVRNYTSWELLNEDFGLYTEFNVGFIEVIPPSGRRRRDEDEEDEE